MNQRGRSYAEFMMHLVGNTKRGRRILRYRFDVRSAVASVAKWFVSAWSRAFPMPSLDDPTTTPPIAKAAALLEAAKLIEDVDAVSGKRVA